MKISWLWKWNYFCF